MCMSSTIETKMSICDKYIRVTADQREDGTIGIKVESDCDESRGSPRK